jgi:hypothetical protein
MGTVRGIVPMAKVLLSCILGRVPREWRRQMNVYALANVKSV